MEGIRRDLFTTDNKVVKEEIRYDNQPNLSEYTKADYEPTFPSKNSQNGRILGKIFQENQCGRMATNGQFMAMYIGRYGARISDLRNMGWDIESSKVSQGKFGYTIDKSQRMENYEKLEEYNGN